MGDRPIFCKYGHSMAKIEINDLIYVLMKVYHCPKCITYNIVCKICDILVIKKTRILSNNFYSVSTHMAKYHETAHNIKLALNGTYIYGGHFILIERIIYLKVNTLIANGSKTSQYDEESLPDIIKAMHTQHHDCVFCGATYDCFPTNEMMLQHLNNCFAIGCGARVKDSR